MMSLNVYYIDIVDLTEVVADTDDPDIYWMKDLMLYKEDKKVLLHVVGLLKVLLQLGKFYYGKKIKILVACSLRFYQKISNFLYIKKSLFKYYM